MRLKELIKPYIKYDSHLKEFLVSIYHLSKYRWWKPKKLRTIAFSEILDQYSKKKGKVKFLQVGSNDGVESDPLRQFIIRDRWSGILVEPLPETYKKLVQNYSSYPFKEDLAFENIAISDKNDELVFYYIDAAKAKIPEGSANKFSSFNKEIPLRLNWAYPSVEANICETKIKTFTLYDILIKYNLEKTLNLLHIDTEGHDYVVLKQINFSITKPDIILFENLHLKMKEYKKCVNELKKQNYILYEQHLDTIAILQDFKEIIHSATVK